MFKNKIAVTIDQITGAIDARETVIFCGAGISFNSGIPVVSQLMAEIIDRLGFAEGERRQLAGAFPSFEAFIQLLIESIGQNGLFDVFDPHGPGKMWFPGKRFANANHYLLASLMKAGRVRTVVTTNFDRLIEEELQFGEPRWVEQKDYDVFYLEETRGDIQGYSDIAWEKEPARPRLIKIHGSMHEKDELAITLARVAKESYSSARKAVIDYVFSNGNLHRQVLVLGYSCSDPFDINPAIERMEGTSQNRVILVEHLTEQDQSNARVEEIGRKEEKNPFKGFARGTRLHYNTDQLVCRIGKRTPGPDFQAADRQRYQWMPVIDRWYRNLLAQENGAAIPGIRGRILQYTGQVSAAVDEFRKAIQVSPEPNSPLLEDCWRRLGEACESMGEYESAIDAFRHALKISRIRKDMGNEARHLCSLANVYLPLEGRPTTYDVFQDRVGDGTLEQAQKFNRNWGGNLGEIKALSGKPRNTIELLFHAQDLAEDARDDENKQRVLRSLGDLFNTAGKYYYVFSYYEWALKYALKVGDIGSQVQLLCSLGDACLETGRMPEAVQYYNQGSATVKETGFKKYESAPLYGLARIDRINGKPAESYRRMEQSLSIARAMKDRKREILCLMELGAILTDRGEHRAAILKLEQALALIQQTRNKELVSECEGRIGISHECMGEYQEAGEHYDRALKSARDVGNQSQEARWLSYYGYNYQHLPDGNNITAVELTEWAVEIAEKTQNEALRRQCAEKYQAARSQRNN